MTATLLPSTFGTPLLPTTPEMANTRRVRTPVQIEHRMRAFLSHEIEAFSPDRIVVIERKGTAILRALKEWDRNPLTWPWRDVMSSSSLSQASDQWFEGKRILIFDDMMRSGEHLLDVLRQPELQRLWETASAVHVAVFAVHEKGTKGREFRGRRIPDAWFYSDLAAPAYMQIRLEIIEMLQRAGSLMLDTEHIEVRLDLRGTLARLVEALSRKAKASVFHSAGRTNITVFYDEDEAHQIPESLFPAGTDLKHIVKKCRVVQRDGTEFAVIPICYPSVPSGQTSWPDSARQSSLFGTNAATTGLPQFYAAAMAGALHVLGWALRDLAVSDPGLYRLYLPTSPSDESIHQGYTLEHLSVMYPTLDIGLVTDEIARIENKAESDANKLRRRKPEAPSIEQTSDEVLHQKATDLLQVIRHVLDERLMERFVGAPLQRVHPHGLTVSEILVLGTRIGCSPSITSCLFDILIDQGSIVTHAELLKNDSGEERWIRTFEPDGEMVSDCVRRLTRQVGLPPGY